MTVQWSTSLRNALLDAYETHIGTAAVFKIRTGAQPANCAAADSGTVLATITLASDWMSAAAAGVKAWSGVPVSDSSADNAGTAAHYRLYASDGVTCHDQGSVTVTGGGGDMTLDTVTFVAGQVFNVTAFTKTAPHA